MKTPIKNYEGIYSIDPTGKVYSDKNGLELKQSLTTTGYYRVNLNNKDGGKTHKVHRLIALHFIPNPDNYKCVNHIDGNKLNNNVLNLEWCTYTHNNRHARKLGLCTTPKGLDSTRCKKVRRLDTGEVFSSLFQAASACGQYASRSSLSNHLAGRTASFDGTIWEFIE